MVWFSCNLSLGQNNFRNKIHFFRKMTKGGSDLVWYSIDRDIFKTESIFLQKKQINPVGSRISLPRSLLTINIWYKMINLLPCLIYDFNQLFQFNWNIYFKHILDGLKLNFKSIDSKINWPQFFCNNSFSTCFDFFSTKKWTQFWRCLYL